MMATRAQINAILIAAGFCYEQPFSEVPLLMCLRFDHVDASVRDRIHMLLWTHGYDNQVKFASPYIFVYIERPDTVGNGI